MGITDDLMNQPMANEEKHRRLEDYWTIFVNSEDFDEGAFAMVYTLTADDLRAYGLSLGVDDDTCKDVIHDLFYHLYIKRKGLQGVENIWSYLFRAFRNRLLNAHRKSGRFLDMELGDQPFSVEVSVLDTLIDEEERRRLKLMVEELLAELTPRQREAIYLRYVQGLDYEEIAQSLGMSADSVRKLVYRAMVSLRRRAKLGSSLSSLLVLLLWGLQH